MKKTKKFTVTREVTVCDRCRSIIDEKPNRYGSAEYLALSFRAGPDSIFEEGTHVHCDLCQSCLKKVLAKYLWLSRDLLFDMTQLGKDCHTGNPT